MHSHINYRFTKTSICTMPVPGLTREWAKATCPRCQAGAIRSPDLIEYITGRAFTSEEVARAFIEAQGGQ